MLCRNERRAGFFVGNAGYLTSKKRFSATLGEATYDLLLKFEHRNTSSAGFNVWVDGEKYGPFQYENLPIKIEGLPWTEQANHKLLICDLSTSVVVSCCLETEFQIECQPPNCEIGELRTWITECDENGAFTIKLDFEHANTSEKFWVATNISDIVYPFSYDALPVEIGPLFSAAGDEVVIEVWDAEFENCGRRKSLGVIDCSPQCRLYDLELGEAICDPATTPQTIDVKLSFKYENIGSEYFVVTTSGGWAKKYKYADLPLLLEDVPVPFNERWIKLQICDSNRSDCCLETELEIPCPPGPCEIGELWTEVSECENGEFKVKLDFDHARTSEKFWVTSNVTDQAFGPFKYEDLPVVVGPIPATSGEEVALIVRDAEYPDCANRKSLGVIDCNPGMCRIFDVELSNPECDATNGRATVKLNFEYEHAGSEYFVVKYENGNLSRYKYADLPVVLENVPIPDDLNRIWIRVCDADVGDCCKEAELEVSCLPDLCEIGEIQTELSDCDDGHFEVEIDFEHTNTGEKFYLSASSSNQVFGPFEYTALPVIVGPIPAVAGEEVVLTVWDKLNESCARRKSLGVVDCPPPNCRLFGLEFGEVECDVADRTASLSVYFDHQDAASDFFIVRTNNGWEEKFKYIDLPVDLTNIPIPDDNNLSLKICDAERDDCCLDFSLALPCPPPDCEIGELRTDVSDCENGEFKLKLDFEYAHTGEKFWVTFNTTDQAFGPFAYEDLPIDIGPLPGSLEETIIEVRDESRPNCGRRKSLGLIHCPPECKLHSLEYSLDCDPATNTFDVKINFEFENTASEHYVLTLENGRQARFKYADLPLRLEDIPYPLDRDKFFFFHLRR